MSDSFDELVQTVRRICEPDGCPWDRVQTHASITKNMVEEAYEAVDAIEAGDLNRMREELGDVLMQVVLQSQIAQNAGEFCVDDVVRGINQKLVRRHPHVFGDLHADTPEEAYAIWEQVKRREREECAAALAAAGTPADATPARPEGLLDSIPRSLPALQQCQKISRKAAAAGFEWDSVDGVWEQVKSEIDEFLAEERGSAAAEMEFGDILFALVNVARHEGIDAENALRVSCAKFRRRWAFMEDAAREGGRSIEDVPNQEQEALWAQAKLKENDL